MTSTVLTNARIVLENEVVSGSIRFAGGLIQDVSAGRVSFPSAIDLDGDYILPGLVDVHTDAFERHALPRPGVRFDILSSLICHDAVLLAAGTTTVFDSLCVGGLGNLARRDLLSSAVAAIDTGRREGVLRADHWLHLRCDLTDKAMDRLMAPHWHHPLLRFVTTMDDSPARDADRARGLFEKRRGLAKGALGDATTIAPLDDEDFAATPARRAQVAGQCLRLGIPVGNHDDTKAEHVAEADRLGIRISEFPIRSEAAAAALAAGHAIICGAANLINGGSHTGNIAVADLVQAGSVDVLCSDYIPASLLAAVFLLTEAEFGLPLPRAVAMASAAPARLFGFADRGSIRPGLRADLIRVRRLGTTPSVRQAWVAGRPVFGDMARADLAAIEAAE